MKRNKLIVILGPTASGKTDFGVWLAQKFNGEIVSADSRQVYKEMSIGTAKPDSFCGVPHHLIDVISLDEEFNVATYKKLAIKTIKEIQKREKIPFLVGGTGLYLRAVVNNINFPRVAPKARLRRKLEKKAPKELFKIYQRLDRKGAQLIDGSNKRRLIRAIEVCEVTKRPFWQQRKKAKPLFDTLKIGIKLSKEKLKKKIEKRVKKMFRQGLEEEVKSLIKKYGRDIPPVQTIGYQEWEAYFKEEVNKEEVKNKIILHTLQFSKRQMTWFKKERRIKWIKTKKEAEKLIKRFLIK